MKLWYLVWLLLPHHGEHIMGEQAYHTKENCEKALWEMERRLDATRDLYDGYTLSCQEVER